MPSARGARFTNGVPELLVLRLLDRREMYGYEIVAAIHKGTGDALQAGEGSIYPILHAMVRNRWITSRRARAAGRTRIYYRLTDRGRAELSEAAARWRRLAAAVQNLLGGLHADDAAPAAPPPAAPAAD
jgi:PadR family transcriptional regulator PadR